MIHHHFYIFSHFKWVLSGFRNHNWLNFEINFSAGGGRGLVAIMRIKDKLQYSINDLSLLNSNYLTNFTRMAWHHIFKSTLTDVSKVYHPSKWYGDVSSSGKMWSIHFVTSVSQNIKRWSWNMSWKVNWPRWQNEWIRLYYLGGAPLLTLMSGAP